MSKVFDEEWLREHNLITEVQPHHSLKDLLATRSGRKLVTISPTATVEDAINLMKKSDISQLPVLDSGMPVGSIQEVTLARVLHDEEDLARVKVGEIMVRPLPQLATTVHLDEVYRLLLAGNTGVLAVEDEKVVGIVTRIDLIEYWNKQRQKEESKG